MLRIMPGQKPLQNNKIKTIIQNLFLMGFLFFNISYAQAYTLVYSFSSDRANPAVMDGAIVDDIIYGFIDNDEGLSQVRFSIDGVEVKVENRAPWDLGGTASDRSSLPYDTNQLNDGTHILSARLIFTNGSESSISSEFAVVNNGPQLISNSSVLNLVGSGSTLTTGNFSLSESAGKNVDISLSIESIEGSNWLTLDPTTAQTPADVFVSANPTGLADGAYEASVVVSSAGYASINLTVNLFVGNKADQLHLTWVNDPATSMAVVWFTYGFDVPTELEYRALGASNWSSAAGNPRHSNNDGLYHDVRLSGLSPSTVYEYRVSLSDGVFSKTYTTKTAPLEFTESFEVVYVADTGLVGRDDGLTQGTQQVINEIAALRPDLLLLGGDYAYFDTDKRYGSLERTIDAWFRQMMPISTYTPMMPTYGNHETMLQETFSDWKPRFPSPHGWENGKMYSFDIADVHFISVYGIHESLGISDSGINWIKNDIQQAQASGARWVIPFFHAAPFSEGTNHPSALKLRKQLGPLFESAGIKVVLTSHDQSFERTFPLIDVPASNTSTSSALNCYDFNDGTTWLKISPGGKLSNISGDFSPWKNSQAPHWTAARDNTMHHYSVLEFNAEGDLIVDTYGVDGKGSAPVLQDTFRYTPYGCSDELNVVPQNVTFQLKENSTQSRQIEITFGNSNVDFTISGLPSWLRATQLQGVTPQSVDLTANSNGLAPGSYSAVLEVQGESSGLVSLPVTMVVTSDVYQLWGSGSSSRSARFLIDGSTVKDRIYVFTAPDDEVTQVQFFIDNPTMSGSPDKTENNAPYDLAGTKPDRTAIAFDTNSLSDGSHEITSKLILSDSSSFVTTSTIIVANSDVSASLEFSEDRLDFDLQAPDDAIESTVNLFYSSGESISFTAQTNSSWLSVSPGSGSTPQNLNLLVDASILDFGFYTSEVQVTGQNGETNTLPVTLNYKDLSVSDHDILISYNNYRTEPVLLEGANISGQVYIFISPDTNLNKVEFYLDNSSLAGKPDKIENRAPWDLGGTGHTGEQSIRLALPFDTSVLSSGSHDLTVRLYSDSGTETISATFMVQ